MNPDGPESSNGFPGLRFKFEQWLLRHLRVADDLLLRGEVGAVIIVARASGGQETEDSGQETENGFHGESSFV
jgi:hypothetical protein